jgi:hypothetical protein
VKVHNSEGISPIALNSEILNCISILKNKRDARFLQATSDVGGDGGKETK